MDRPELAGHVPEPDPEPGAASHPAADRDAGRSAPEARRASAVRVGELRPVERRRAVVTTTGVIVAVWAVVLLAYYLHPGTPSSATGAVTKMVIGIALIVAVLIVEYMRIVRARVPHLRTVEALGVTLPLFFAVFSSVYLSLGAAPHPMFTTTLDHTRALYFVVTVFSTVGFGDIAPTTDTARLIVAFQMLLDLTFIGVVVRALVVAANRRLDRGS